MEKPIVTMRDLCALPWIQLFASTACNLKCAYCSQNTVRTDKIHSDLLLDSELFAFISGIPPTHIYLSGGEPLIHPGVKEFIAHAGRSGHKVSFDTNIVVPMKILEDLLSYWDPSFIGFVNISHHIVCGIPLDYIMERSRLLKDAGVDHFVKYVGVPEMLPQIESNMRHLRSKSVGAAVTILLGNWKGRTLPVQYTPEEAARLLKMVTLCTHGLQLFGGIYSRSQPCRGGADFICYNMHGNRKVVPCCHGTEYPLALDRTFFTTGDRSKIKCRIESCLGDLMFICGINGMADEIERFEALCKGNFDFVGANAVIVFIHEILKGGHRLVNSDKLAEIVSKGTQFNCFDLAKIKDSESHILVKDFKAQSSVLKKAKQMSSINIPKNYVDDSLKTFSTEDNIEPVYSIQKIKETIRSIPVLGSLSWMVYKYFKALLKINELTAKGSGLKSKYKVFKK